MSDQNTTSYMVYNYRGPRRYRRWSYGNRYIRREYKKEKAGTDRSVVVINRRLWVPYDFLGSDTCFYAFYPMHNLQGDNSFLNVVRK